MASTSLGTLTLDLAVRLSEFTDGLTRAERETRDRTESMGDSVGKFKERLVEDLSGTPIGDAVGSLTEKLSSITEAFGEGGLAGAAAIGAASVIGSVVAIGAGLVTLALQTAEADEQLVRLATRANTSTTNLQVLTAATGAYGLEMESVGDILADAQEKLGEFSATGGGGLVDTLELMQNATKKTDAELEIFGKSLSTMDSVDAIQAVVDEMEKAGATSQEVRFVTESLASGLGDIIPLWDNNGEALRNYENDLNEAGVIRTKESIEQSQILANEMEGLQIKFEGVSNQLVTEALPAMATLIEYFKEGTTQGGSFKNEISGVGRAINITAASVVGIAAGIGQLINAFSAVGMQMRNIGQTAQNFYNADNLADRGKALFTGFFSAGALASGSMLDISSQWANDMETINKLLEGASSKMNQINTQRPAVNTSFGSVLNPKGNNAAFPYRNDGIPYRTGAVDVEIIASRAIADAAEEEAKAQEKLAKANDKTAKSLKGLATAKLSVNAKALANAENYGFANYEAKYGLPYGLMTGIHMQESHGNPNATGPMTKYGKAKGGFQMIDATAKRFGVDDPYNMTQATEGAAKYLSWLYERFEGDLAKTIAAYNTGEGNVDKHPMSLILSDRWARNKKTGIGQTKEYTKNVLGYMKSATTDTSKLVYDTVAKQALEAQKLQEETLRRQVSIQTKYATDREKLDRDYAANITEIESLYAEGSIERTELLNRAKAEYDQKRTAAAKSILESYMADEEKLTYEHNKKIERINVEFAEDDQSRQLLIDLQNAAYQEDLANFKFASQAKARAQDKMYQSIANSMRTSSLSAASNGLDSMAQRTMSDDEYSVWRLGQDRDESFNSINSQYSNRQSEINATDERGNFELPELERFELLERAKQEHMDNMWAMDQEYALKQQSLDEQLKDKRVAIQANAFGAMTDIAAMFFGENSRLHQAAFIMERTFAVQKALMNVKETQTNTFNSLSAIPLIGPYIAGPGSYAAAAIQVATAAGIQGISTPSVAGIAHGGLDNVPEEATYLLQKDERVLSPKQNKDLVKFMANGQKASAGNITINNNSKAEVSARQNPDGTVTVDMVDKMIEKSFKRIGRANSIESKSIQRGTTARVNRR
ncbi:lytic transglycosylase domain-containing protein [Psychrobacter sp. 28M-43]|uniref:lytic transglycosylase domain-containing protein n=1 Tax=Psychrobacter sp. 28M-43 TaxID=2772254 RepID=UPI00168D4C07|nr:lytic transglycosylase domain-containing protein [Psychrobacter sp. 28M-43]QOD13533.1 lytic transglycosylase domain-containing protein [Psychrobacter sp. 28M-43]